MQMNFVCSCLRVAVDGNLKYLGNKYGEIMNQKLYNIFISFVIVCVCLFIYSFLNTYNLCAIGETS